MRWYRQFLGLAFTCIWAHRNLLSLDFYSSGLAIKCFISDYESWIEWFHLTQRLGFWSTVTFSSHLLAPLKNAIDWASRPPNCWADKAAAIVSTGGSFGGGLAQYHLRQIGIYLDLHFINKPEFHLNAFAPPAKFDSNGNLIDPQSKDRLKEVLLSLLAFTLRLKGNS